MRKGLAMYVAVLLLAAALLPLVNAQEAPESEFSPELGDELSAYGRGYVENLVLWSGAGIHLAWGPSYAGNTTALEERLSDLEGLSGGSMPNGTTPMVVPFKAAKPAFADPAPLDHSQDWTWNMTDVEARVHISSLASTITAETHLAMGLMGTGMDDDEAEALLLLEAAIQAAMFSFESLGYNGTDMVPFNWSDPNMTDNDPSNGWWLPVTEAIGTLDAVDGSWDAPALVTGPGLDASLSLLRALVGLSSYVTENSALLVGPGMAFPSGTDTALEEHVSALFNNVYAAYYDADDDMFLEDEKVHTGTLALLYGTLTALSESPVITEYWASWSGHWAERAADLLVGLQRDDGSLMMGYDTSLGGIPGTYIPPYLPIPQDAEPMDEIAAVAALYDAAGGHGRLAYAAGAQALLAHVDASYRGDEGMYLDEPSIETPTYLTSYQVAVLRAFASAVEGVDLAKHRIPEVWDAMVAAGLQLSETDATGEDYGNASEDSDGDGIPKHNASRGEGREHGVAPVLAVSSTLVAGGNWSVEWDVDTMALMEAAVAFMMMDGPWFEAAGAPEHSSEHAWRLLHWTPADWLDHDMQVAEEVANLTAQLEELRNQAGNVTELIEELRAEIAALQDSIALMERDLNESRENETVLRNQTRWLREKLEETNETVDQLEEDIERLEDQVARLEKDLMEKDENVTKLKDQLRSEEHNVTLLRWEMENASVAVTDAERDLKAANKKLDDREEELSDLEGRLLWVGIIGFIAGVLVILAILKVLGKL